VSVDAIGGPADIRMLVAVGELDIVVVPRVLERFTALLAGATAVVLDVSAVTFLDSSGLRLVDRLARECGGRGAPFRVVAPPGCASRRVLEIVEMTASVMDDRLAAESAVRAELSARAPRGGVSGGPRSPAA